MSPLVIALILTSAIGIYSGTQQPASSPVRDFSEHPVSISRENRPTNTTEPVIALPEEVNIAMPFYTQAPMGRWIMPFQEACEEASALLIANLYYKHNWTREQFNEQILALVEWEKQQFNKYIDTSAEENAKIFKEYLNLQTKTHENPSLEDVKKILANGHLIMGFFAGKELHNPNYKNGGPNYHVIVIKGYRNNDQIITADVGTERGGDYIYSWDTIHNALHDLNDPIQDGGKRILEVWPAN